MQAGKLSNLRQNNRELILKTLSRQSLSCSELSRVTGLSGTGVITIVDELIGEGILVKTEAETTTSVGRRPLPVHISKNCGVVAVMQFAGRPKLYLFSLAGELLREEYLPERQRYSQADVDCAADLLAQMTAQVKNRLLNITISAPGKIRKQTGAFVWSPFFENDQSLNLRQFFSDRFGVETYIKNDLRFALLAEKKRGKWAQKIHNTLYLQLGQGIGSALFLDGKLFEGSHGLNGEIALFRTNCLKSVFGYNADEEHYFQSVCSYNAIVSRVQNIAASGFSMRLPPGKTVADLTIDDVAAGYLANEPLCTQVVDGTAKITAEVIISLVEVLDFSSVVISSLFHRFGDRYIQRIADFVNQSRAQDPIEFLLSEFTDGGSVVGAMDYAVEKAIQRLAADEWK